MYLFIVLFLYMVNGQLLSTFQQRKVVLKDRQEGIMVGDKGTLVFPINAKILTSKNMGDNCKTLIGLRFNLARKNTMKKKLKKLGKQKKKGRKYISFFRNFSYL